MCLGLNNRGHSCQPWLSSGGGSRPPEAGQTPGSSAADASLCGLFGGQATLVASSSGASTTACPQGINIVSFFAFTNLVMLPAYKWALRQEMSIDDAARHACVSGPDPGPGQRP